MIPVLVVLFLAAGALAFWYVVRSRNLQFWLGSYFAEIPRRAFSRARARRHVYFCFADHYEPYGGTSDRTRAHERVARWEVQYPAVADRHQDSNGGRPKHSFFYPIEEYDPALLDRIGNLCRRGYGDVEVHLHHDGDSAENLRRTLDDYVKMLHQRHGLLRRDPETGKVIYCFIHGNWALDNSRPDGRWCGVNNEIDVLVQTGCYADMTMPSAPSDTQTRKINSIYFARGCPGQRKSHDRGRDVRVGTWAQPDELLLIQGPLTLNWRDARFGLIPRIESAEVSFDAPPTAHRIALWGRFGATVRGAEEHIFIKVHTHGATERSMDALFNGGFDTLWTELERQYRDQPGCMLHYVSAWEMYSRIRAIAALGPENA